MDGLCRLGLVLSNTTVRMQNRAKPFHHSKLKTRVASVPQSPFAHQRDMSVKDEKKQNTGTHTRACAHTHAHACIGTDAHVLMHTHSLTHTYLNTQRSIVLQKGVWKRYL